MPYAHTAFSPAVRTIMKKMGINLDNRKFRPLTNSQNGEVSDSTLFYYHQENEMIWAEYSGGDVLRGFLIGKIIDHTLEFSYQHLNRALEIMTGKCRSRIELSESGKIQLFEDWEWTCKDFSKGKSTLIEI